MIYITGDTHGDFKRFTRKERERLPFVLTEEDYVMVCGDLGLLWEKNGELKYNLNWLSGLPFTLLWVSGNHENYDMIAEYPLEEWKGGKVRHIVKDKIILLERGQVFTLEGKTFFTMGGASSHDVQGGILDKNSPTYRQEKKKALLRGISFRVLNVSWWAAELPTEEELQEGRRNLEKVDYKVDYVITHCASNRMQEAIECHYGMTGMKWYQEDCLTNYFEELEEKLQYKHWFFGHYHDNLYIDEKHTLLYEEILPLEKNKVTE